MFLHVNLEVNHGSQCHLQVISCFVTSRKKWNEKNLEEINLKLMDFASVELKQNILFHQAHKEASIKLGDGPMPTVRVFNYLESLLRQKDD